MEQPGKPLRPIPDPGFAGDDGSAAAPVAAALTAYDDRRDHDHYLRALALLQDARVLVPVVAVADEVEYDADGRAVDKTSEMAAVMLTGHDGRLALLAFTSTRALAAWDPGARPVPVTLRSAVRAALQQESDAVVVDVAGPVMLAVEGPVLHRLGSGSVLVQLSEGWGWAGPE